jgi:salicylate hydroxylase
MVSECELAIVGGGISGLTLAAALSRNSVSVQIFEQDTELREIGAGIAIGGNATRLLKILDIDLADVGNVPPAVEFRRWRDGELLWAHPIGDWYLGEVGAPLLMLHRATLQRRLAAAVPPELIHFDHRLIGLSEESDGVRLLFANGGEVVANAVVGADGVHSPTRRYICGDVGPVHSGEIGFRGVIPVHSSEDLPAPTSLHCWCGPRTHVVYYGMDRGELVNLLAVYQPDRLPAWTEQSDRRTATVEEALATFESYAWDRRILDLVRNIEGDMSFWALIEMPRLARWSRGRVGLMGDAAHAPLPHQGQGGGLAIEDAYVLAMLILSRGLQDPAAIFSAFESCRSYRSRKVQAYSRMAGRAYKFIGQAATVRDAQWSSLPQRIDWIHRYHAEDTVVAEQRADQPITQTL